MDRMGNIATAQKKAQRNPIVAPLYYILFSENFCVIVEHGGNLRPRSLSLGIQPHALVHVYTNVTISQKSSNIFIQTTMCGIFQID